MSSVLFDYRETIEYGRKVRTGRAPGQQSWQPLKEKFGGAKYAARRFRTCASLRELAIACEIDTAAETLAVDGRAVLVKREPDHFAYQVLAIPFKENELLTYVKLMQIAYNVGQHLASAAEGEYSQAAAGLLARMEAAGYFADSPAAICVSPFE